MLKILVLTFANNLQETLVLIMQVFLETHKERGSQMSIVLM